MSATFINCLCGDIKYTRRAQEERRRDHQTSRNTSPWRVLRSTPALPLAHSPLPLPKAAPVPSLDHQSLIFLYVSSPAHEAFSLCFHHTGTVRHVILDSVPRAACRTEPTGRQPASVHLRCCIVTPAFSATRTSPAAVSADDSGAAPGAHAGVSVGHAPGTVPLVTGCGCR